MNIIQVQDQLKGLPDQVLQKELLNPSGAAPSYLVLSELNRRKEMRAAHAGKPPSSSMAEEFAQGVGGADVGRYSEAVRGATQGMPAMGQMEPVQGVPPGPMGQGSPMGQMPPQPQQFASGGEVEMAPPAPSGADGMWSDYESWLMPGFLTGKQSLGEDLKDRASGLLVGPGLRMLGVKPFASGGYVAPLGQPMPNGGMPVQPMNPMAPMAPMVQAPGQMVMGPNGVPMAPGAAPAGGVAGAVSPAVAPAILGMIGSMDGSADGGTGDAGGNSGEAGGVGAGVGTAAGDAAASAAAADAGDGTWAAGGVVRMQTGGDPGWLERTRNRFRGAMDVPPVDLATDVLGQAPASSRPLVDWSEAGKALSETGKLFMAPINRLTDLYAPKGSAFDPPAYTSGRPDLGVPPSAPYGPSEPLPPIKDYSTSPFPGSTLGLPPGLQGGSDEPTQAPVGTPQSSSGGRDRVPPPAPNATGRTGDRGGGGRGGVGSALNIADQSFEDYVMKMRSLAPPDRFESIRQQNEEERNKAKAALETDKGLALLQAGLGIMAGQSPFAAVNIGQGAQAGAKYWQEAGRESRMADQAIRQAEVQMAAAQANNDQRSFDRAATLHAQAEMKKMQLAEMAARAGQAAADRAAAREDRAQDRALLREQHEIDSHAKSYNAVNDQYDKLVAKIATLQTNALAGEPGAQDAIGIAKNQLETLDKQKSLAYDMYQQSLIRREVNNGRLAAPKSQAEYDKLPPGTRYLDTDGKLKVKK